jgi:hypothetical protein
MSVDDNNTVLLLLLLLLLILLIIKMSRADNDGFYFGLLDIISILVTTTHIHTQL